MRSPFRILTVVCCFSAFFALVLMLGSHLPVTTDNAVDDAFQKSGAHTLKHRQEPLQFKSHQWPSQSQQMSSANGTDSRLPKETIYSAKITPEFSSHRRSAVVAGAGGKHLGPEIMLMSAIVGVKTCSGARRPSNDTLRYRNGVWQVQKLGLGNDRDEVVVFSAFYDDRPLVGVTRPKVRINGVRPAAYVADSNRQLYCYLWYPRRESPVVAEASAVQAGGEGHVVTPSRVLYAQFLYSCQLPFRKPIPSHVSLVEGGTRKCLTLSPTTMLAVQRRLPANRSYEHQFATCTETSFGDVRPEVVVEWIESNRMFGVTLFNIYDGAISNNATRQILKWYAERGIVRLTRLPPAVDDDTLEGVKLSSPTSFNDCLMTNMYAVRFLVVLDFDELIVPRLTHPTNYASLVDNVDRRLGRTGEKGNYHTYMFRNVYFFTFYDPDDKQPAGLRTMRYRQRTPPNEYRFAAKSFVDPLRCLLLFNHYCLKRLPEADEVTLGVAVDVPTDLGLSHHYRAACELEPDVCAEYQRLKQNDDVMLAYRDTLDYRVRRTRSEVNW